MDSLRLALQHFIYRDAVESASEFPMDPQPRDSEQTVVTLSRLTIQMMEKRGIDPTPENYAIWYAYARADDKALLKEIDMLLERKVPFTRDINRSLHARFIAKPSGQQAGEDATINAHKILADLLKVIHDFGGETDSYGKNVDQYVEKISVHSGNKELHDIVKEIISGAASLQQSGRSMRQELEESTREVQELRENLSQLSLESQRDFLTGLFNRKALDRKLEEQMASAREHNSEFCLLMLDIDHFKKFNDNYGHLIGDEVLKLVAKSLTDCVKGKDVVARYGGEEFSVLLPATPLAGASVVAESIRKTIASRELKRRDTKESYGVITVSVGIARYRADTDSAASLVQRADNALYYSKQHGRNRVTPEGHP